MISGCIQTNTALYGACHTAMYCLRAYALPSFESSLKYQ